MSRIYAQATPVVWESSASLAAAGSATSGSFVTEGYTKLVGGLIANASAKAGSGLRISQSFDRGVSWDHVTDLVPTACTSASLSLELIGNAAKIEYRTDSAASLLRTAWRLRPI